MGEADKQQIRAFLQGSLIGMIQRDIATDSFPVKIANIDQQYDSQGRYNNYFTLETVSGKKFRVTIEAEES